MKIVDKIRQQIETNPIILYMKGTPDNPQCGFSATAVKALKTTRLPYAYVNVLEQPFIREKLPSVSDWPTFPQLFVKGELVGGSDIVDQLAQDGQLKTMLESAVSEAGQE